MGWWKALRECQFSGLQTPFPLLPKQSFEINSSGRDGDSWDSWLWESGLPGEPSWELVCVVRLLCSPITEMAQSRQSSCGILLKIKRLSETFWVQCFYIFQWKTVCLEISWPVLSEGCALSELDMYHEKWQQITGNGEWKTVDGRTTVTSNSSNIFHVLVCLGFFLMVQFTFFFVFSCMQC